MDHNWLNAQTIICPNCMERLWRVNHSPMLDDHKLYCDQCANSVEISFYDPTYSSIRKALSEKGQVHYRELMNAVEQKLKPCNCGGHFKHDASRRCYKCLTEIIKDEPGVDLYPKIYDFDTEERAPTSEEQKAFQEYDDTYICRENIWK